MISALEDGLLREIALGGPDTTTRIKTIAQVRVVAVPQTSVGILISANAAHFLPMPDLGTLTTLQPQVTQNADLCQLPDPNNFTGRQNRLYRVEVHEGGDPIGQPVGVGIAQDAPVGTAILFLVRSLTPSQVDAVTRSGIITVADNANNAVQASVTGISPDGKSITLTNPLTITFATANNAQVLVGGAQTLAASLAQDASVGATTLFLATALNPTQIDAVTRWGVITVMDNAGNLQKMSVAGVSPDGKTITLTNPLTIAFTVANQAQIIGIARFKWSRDNASFAVSVIAVSSDRRTLTLSSLGRDQATALGQGDLVEICDDASELGPSRGLLTNLQSDPDPDQLTVVITDPLPPNFQTPGNVITSPPGSSPSSLSPPDRHLVLRRWDGQGVARTAFSTTATPDMNLGDGVQIQFGGTNLLPGDYWQFTARSTDGSIEALTNAPPVGIARFRCPLAIVRWSANPGSPPSSPPRPPGTYSLSLIEDCRTVFSPLVDAPRTEAGLHILQVFTVNQATNQIAQLFNDSTVLVSTITSGINVLCDAAVDPASVKRPTCFLTVETPQTAGANAALVGYNPLSVDSSVAVSGDTITWLPSLAAAQSLQNLALLNPGGSGILARFVLKGNYIWTATNPPLFLDGEALGSNNGGLTALTFASGKMRRGPTDFEMWFWLVAQPVALQSLVLSQTTQVFPNTPVTGTVQLTNPATAGLVVQLASSNPAVATVPQSVSFTLGATSANFAVTAITPGTTNITASLQGSPDQTAPLAVVAPPVTLVPPMTINPSAITQNGVATGTITLSGQINAGSVTLSSNNPNVATVPASIPFSAFSVVAPFSASFPVQPTNSPGVAEIIAVFGNSSVAAPVQVFKAKDKDKEKDIKEIVKEKELIIDKVGETKLIHVEVAPSVIGRTPLSLAAVTNHNGNGTANGRAFIRSEERPAIVPTGWSG
jgi:hypothetical protein